MNNAVFESEFQSFGPMLHADVRRLRYPAAGFWESIGTHALDIQLSGLADFYGRCRAAQRRTLRRSISVAASCNLLVYVRRMSLQIMETWDPIWLVRALAAASLENAQFDYRDSIVSLVIARAGAESVDIDPLAYFESAIDKCDPEMVPMFTNARDHRPNDVRDILREFGPPELKPKRKRRTS